MGVEKKYVDYIGDIMERMNANNCTFGTANIDTLKNTNDTAEILIGLYDKMEQKEGNCKEEQPHRSVHSKRLVLFADRRDEKEETDKVYLIEPPAVCRDIPYNACFVWHLYASNVCLLPGKDDESEAMEDNTIGSYYKQPNLLTLSFHVLAEDQIKCYLFF